MNIEREKNELEMRVVQLNTELEESRNKEAKAKAQMAVKGNKFKQEWKEREDQLKE